MRALRVALLGIVVLLLGAPTTQGAASATFNVFVSSNAVHGYDWPLGVDVTLLIDDPGVPGPVDYSDAQTVVVAPWDPGQTWVEFVVPEAFNIQPGHVVTLMHDTTTKIHTVTNLAVTSVDPDTDIVVGTADPGSDVWVDTCCSSRHEVANGSGDWSADFSTFGDEDFEQDTFDIVPGSQGQANEVDADDDGTVVDWRVPNPHFYAWVADDRVQGYEWPEGAEITLTIDDPGIPGPVDYADSGIVGPAPWNPDEIGVFFELWGIFDLLPGHIVTLFHNTATKVHTVTGLEVTDVDPDTDTISGTTAPGAEVWVNFWGEFGNWRREVANGSGNWTADFSIPGDDPGEEATSDVVPGSNGVVNEHDSDSDGTSIGWQVPNPQFNVRPEDDLVEGYEWEEGAEATLTIDDPGTGPGADYTDTTTVGPAPWDPQHIVAFFDFQGVFDVQPGHEVALTDGVTTKEHTVTNLALTAADPDTDTVFGTADPGSDVRVDTCCASRHEVANGSGNWSADFSTFGDEDFEQDTFDIVPGSQGQVGEFDADGDGTTFLWQVPDPRLEAWPVDERVQGWNWEEGTEVTLTIDDPGTGPGVDYTDSQIVGPAPWDPQQIGVFFELWDIFDVQPGQLVTLTDSATTKEHTVTNLAVTDIDPDTDTVSGTADPGAEVWVQVWEEFGANRQEFADGSGDWTADFSTPGDEDFEQDIFDIVPGNQGNANQPDSDSDITLIAWRVPDPHFFVSPLDDGVNGNDWSPGAEVTLTIDDTGTGPGADYTESGTADAWGNVGFYFYGTFDVQPGHEVTLTDGTTTKEHTVTSLAVTDVDPDTDTVSGTADPGSDVEVHTCDQTGCVYRYEVADGGGDWAADFSTPGGQPEEQDTYDIVPGSGGEANQWDVDGDGTHVHWWVPDPRFNVWLDDQRVDGYDFAVGTLVTLTIDDPGTPEPVDYTDTQPVTSDPWSTWVSFAAYGVFDIQAGHVVTLADGVTTKEHTVTNLEATVVDQGADTVSGTAGPGTHVDVDVWGKLGPTYRHEVADGSGNWTADFSTPGDEPGEEGTVDLVPGTRGTASQQDAEDDATIDYWAVPNMWVWPDRDAVDGYDWPRGAEITLTIDDPDTGPGVDYTDSATADRWPWGTIVSFDLSGSFDVQPDDVVTLTDGVNAREHTVTSLAVTSVNPDTDVVVGTTAAGSDVNVSVGGGPGGATDAWRHEVADGSGNWTADFSTPGDEPGEGDTFDIVPRTGGMASQPDADGDKTIDPWYVPYPRSEVWPGDDRVDGYDFAVGAVVTLTIDDPGTGPGADYSDSDTAVPLGPLPGNTSVSFDLQGVFDIQPGFLVTLSDGVTTKVHTVTNVAVTGADPDTDTVSGTAAPVSDIDIYACTKGCEYRHEVADGSGNWTADFSIPGDESGEEGTFDIGPFTSSYAVQTDPDGDETVVWWADLDGDGIPDAEDPDDDNDGFTDEFELYAGTNPRDHCADTPIVHDEDPPDAWPLDFNDDQRASMQDAIFAFVTTLQPYGGLNVPVVPGLERVDFKEDGFINMQDAIYAYVTKLQPLGGLNATCTP